MDHGRQQPIEVEGLEGLRGTVPELPAYGAVELTLDDGRRAMVPVDAFSRRNDGKLYLPLRLVDLAGLNGGSSTAGQKNREPIAVIPVVREALHVGKERVETARVVVRISPQVRTEAVEMDLADESVEVERVPVNRIVDQPEPPREDGDVTVVPVYEEVLVVQKKLRLKEEVRIRRRHTVRRERQNVELRSEQVQVSRTPAQPGSDARERPTSVEPQRGSDRASAR